MEKEDKRGIFFGIVGVLTLIVAIIGASLAYFSINAKSDKDALIVQSATVKIVYEDGDKLLNVEELIPSTQEIAIRTLERTGDTNSAGEYYKACEDDNGYTVCGYYDFTLTNGGPNEMNISAKVIPSELEEEAIRFTHLKFALYDRSTVSDDEYNNGALINSGTIGYDEFSLLDDDSEPLKIAGNNTVKNLRLFVWLNEAGKENDNEQGATFKGTIEITVLDNEGNAQGSISGYVEE